MGEEQDAGYRGLESKWQAYRYEGLKGLSLKDEQQELAWDLFLKGDFDYYYDLKKLSTDGETEFYEKVKLELQKESGRHYRSLLLQLIKEENDIKALLEFVKKHPMYVEEYADVLFEHYEQDMIEIYREYIESEAKASSNRKQYRKLCYRLNNFKKYAGKEQQIVLIEKLMEENKRRPAFLDELNKLL